MIDISREEALAHFGVKGQRWGVRKKRTPGDTSPSADPRKLNRKERKVQLTNRLNESTKMAIENPKQLFALRQGNVTTVLSGKEFTDALLRSNGRLYVTDISPFELLNKE